MARYDTLHPEAAMGPGLIRSTSLPRIVRSANSEWDGHDLPAKFPLQPDLNFRATLTSSAGNLRREPKPGGGVWRSREFTAAAVLPPLTAKAVLRRRPCSEQKAMPQGSIIEDRQLVDYEAADSYGRRRLGECGGEMKWAHRVFREADLSESGHLCPAEFAAMIESLKRHLGPDATARFRQAGHSFNFTVADLNLEGRLRDDEWLFFAQKIQAVFGLQRCVRAAARYLGTRQAEARRRVKSIELFEGYSTEASIHLLTACNNFGRSSIFDQVKTALEAKADPNAALTCPVLNGYTPLIVLAKTPPTMHGGEVAKAMRLLLAARADPHRESGRMPFGRWAPLRFAAFMQNVEGLDVLLEHLDSEGILGDRFQWAANENVEHVMLRELNKEFGSDLTQLIASKSRYSMLATVLLQQYASPIAGGSLTPVGVMQLINGEFQSGSLPKGCRANPSGAGLEGRTALMDMVEAGDVKTVKALLKGKASVNLKDSSGATALHMAASCMQVEVVRALLDAKAEPHKVDHAGLSPWMLVGEELAHRQSDDGQFHIRTDGKMGSPEARRELLQLLKPAVSPEEILARLQEDWQSALDPEIVGGPVTLETLEKNWRLRESLFFSSKLADGHGAHEGRQARVDLLAPLAAELVELLKTEHLKGEQKVLTRYLLQATMGPSFKTDAQHIHTPWPTQDNRYIYRDALRTVTKDMMAQYALECGVIREKIEQQAEAEPGSPCADLLGLPSNRVEIPASWLEKTSPDSAFWQQVKERQLLRYDPQWAREVGGSLAMCCLQLLRLGAVEDLERCAELNQVYHSSMTVLLARGYVRYSELCNVAFQEKMKVVANRLIEREGLNIAPPGSLIAPKKLERILEKVQEAKEELGTKTEWANRTPEYIYHSHAFHILDTVRLSFCSGGETTEDQVKGCMKLYEEFKSCTVEKDGLCVLRQKSGFASGSSGAGGYADLKLLIYAELGSFTAFDGTSIPLQIVGEVQLILESYMQVKKKMHLVYEVDRGSFERDGRARSHG